MYSYLQYHWCPIAFRVTSGLLTSSIRYRSRREGRARNSRMIAGSTVQIISIIWASCVYRLDSEFVSSEKNPYTTRERISIIMVIA